MAEEYDSVEVDMIASIITPYAFKPHPEFVARPYALTAEVARRKARQILAALRKPNT